MGRDRDGTWWPSDDDSPRSDSGKALQAGRRKGQQALQASIRRVLRDKNTSDLLSVLNVVARVPPCSPENLIGRQTPPGVSGALLQLLQEAQILGQVGPGVAIGLLCLDHLALALIAEGGARTSKSEVKAIKCFEVLFSIGDGDPQAWDLDGRRTGARLLLALWGAPEEWQRRLRHCNLVGCETPYFLDKSPNRKAQYCSKKHLTYSTRLLDRFEKSSPRI